MLNSIQKWADCGNEDLPVSEKILGSVVSAFFFFCFCLIIFFAVGFTFTFKLNQAKELSKTLSKEHTIPYGHLIGRIKSVETWEADDFITDVNGFTITLHIKDRCKIIFEDGRSKELLGIPIEVQ